MVTMIEDTVTPLAAKLGQQKYITSIRDGFIAALPFMIVGSFMLVFIFPPFDPETKWGFARAWLDFAKTYFPALASRPLAGAGEWLLLPAPGSETLNTAKLRVVRGGVLAGSVLKKRFQPAHALFMAYGAQCTNREELTLTDPRTAAWLRGEEIDAATAQNGWCAVLVDGFPLGGGKVSGGRIKNHYPKGLRNLQ
jgi:NOL1/NOP2/fmu family ribosome biogenesis protein